MQRYDGTWNIISLALWIQEEITQCSGVVGFATMINLSPYTLQSWLNGLNRDISLAEIEKIAQYRNMRVTEVFRWLNTHQLRGNSRFAQPSALWA